MFLPDNIDFTQSKIYILSIRLTPNGFYFSIHCPSDTTVFYQKSTVFSSNANYLKSLEKIVFDYSFFNHNYLRINVIHVNDRLTLVPTKYYDKKFESDILSFNLQSPIMKTMSNGISNIDCQVVWEIDESHHSFLSRSLLNPIFKSHLSILISFFYRLHNKSNSTLFVNFNDDDLMDIIAFSNENLIFAKTFVAINPLEESYYIQKTWEVLNMNLQADTLIFSGRTANHSNCIETLKKVIKKQREINLKKMIH